MSGAAERNNLVIEAGAGTGKTTAIVREVLRLLLDEPDITPERIVLMTFTEKAAGEIADRIREGLSDLESTLDSGAPRWPSDASKPIVTVPPDRLDAARLACARHLAQVDRLRSQTIHAFCQTLLRLYPIEAGLSPQFRIVEGFERARLVHDIYGEWLDEEIGPDTPASRIAEWRTLYRHYAGLDRLEETLLSLVSRSELLADGALSLGDITDVDASIRRALDDVRSIPGADLDALRDETKREAIALLRRDPPPDNPPLEAWLEWFAPVEELLPLIDLRPGKRSVNATLRAIRGGETDASESIPSLLRSHQIAMTIRAVAMRLASFLDAQKELRGLVDFDDLLGRASRLLDNPRVLAEVRERYDHIFVDEFQDTDRIQARIIDQLARDATGAIVPGKVTIVGDPKQSIYSFRRADPETYRDTVAAFRDAGARHEFLGTQYRSDPALVAALNAIFSQLFPARAHDPNIFRPEYGELAAAKPPRDDRDASRVRLLMAAADEGRSALEDEAEAVADWIAARRGDDGRELRRFAILLRKSKGIPLFADALERRGMRCIVPPAGSLLDQPAAVDMLAVLRAIAHPFDFAAMISAARSPYFALTDDEILEHRVACEGSTRACPWDGFTARLAAWRAVARHGDVAGTIEMILRESAIESLFDVARDGGRARAHVDRLLEIAASFDADRGGSLAQFVDELVARRDKLAESEPNSSDESADAVRIMTVHASKGLEFDTVILPDLAFKTSSDRMSIFATESPRRLVMTGTARSISSWWRPSPDANPLGTVAAERRENEEDRLFYVAVTRAKSDVVLVCHPDAEMRGFTSRLLRILGDASPADMATRWPDNPGALRADVNVGGARVPMTFERMAPPASTDEVGRFLADAAAAIAARPFVDGAALAASLAESLPSVETLDRGEAARRLALSSGRIAGILLHRVLERWDGDDRMIAGLVERLATETGADGADAGKVLRRVSRLRETPAWSRFAAMQLLGRELPLWTRDAQSGAEEGRIDLLLRDGDECVVVDYKGGKPSPERVARDSRQVEAYCRAISAMSSSPCRGMLWYIDLERDELVELPGETRA